MTSSRRIKVTAGVVMRGGRILIARRAGDDPLAGKWEFPGGKIEPGEEPEACLKRELLEELGIEVRIGRLLGSTQHDYPQRKIELLFFEADWQSGEPTPHIHDKIAWVNPSELLAYDLAPADILFARTLCPKTKLASH